MGGLLRDSLYRDLNLPRTSLNSFKNSPSKPYRPPAMIQPASPVLKGLRRKAFAVGYELKMKPFMVKDRAHVLFDEPVFDRLAADQLDYLIRSLEEESAERKRRSRRTAEIFEVSEEPPFEQGGPSRFAIGIELMDKGRDVRTGKPIESMPLIQTNAADDLAMNHPLVKHVRARFPHAQVVTRISTRRDA
jgi:hypothetical protein